MNIRNGLNSALSTALLLAAICICGAQQLVLAQEAARYDSVDKPPGTCPDLAGTYLPDNKTWLNQFLIVRRPVVREKQFATLQRSGTGYTLVWHVARPDFLAAVSAHGKADPYRYGHWRAMMESGPRETRRRSLDEWFNQLAHRGPVFRRDLEVPFKECKEGWFLIASGEREGPADFEGGRSGPRDVELWLGHAKDGALVLRRIEYKIIQFKYPVKMPGIRLTSRTYDATWPPAPQQDMTPIRLDELPAADRPVPKPPRCQITEEMMDAFIDRVMAFLPPRATVENQSSQIADTRPLPDGSCRPTQYTLTIQLYDVPSVDKVADKLRSDPFIRQLDRVQTISETGDYRRVRYWMLAAP